MLSASFNTHNCDTKIRLLLAKPYTSKWDGRTLTPTYFSRTKVGGSSSTKGWVLPFQPPSKSHPELTERIVLSRLNDYLSSSLLNLSIPPIYSFSKQRSTETLLVSLCNKLVCAVSHQ